MAANDTDIISLSQQLVNALAAKITAGTATPEEVALYTQGIQTLGSSAGFQAAAVALAQGIIDGLAAQLGTGAGATTGVVPVLTTQVVPALDAAAALLQSASAQVNSTAGTLNAVARGVRPGQVIRAVGNPDPTLFVPMEGQALLKSTYPTAAAVLDGTFKRYQLTQLEDQPWDGVAMVAVVWFNGAHYAIPSGNVPAVLRSTDNGRSWTTAFTPYPGGVAAVTTARQVLIADAATGSSITAYRDPTTGAVTTGIAPRGLFVSNGMLLFTTSQGVAWSSDGVTWRFGFQSNHDSFSGACFDPASQTVYSISTADYTRLTRFNASTGAYLGTTAQFTGRALLNEGRPMRQALFFADSALWIAGPLETSAGSGSYYAAVLRSTDAGVTSFGSPLFALGDSNARVVDALPLGSGRWYLAVQDTSSAGSDQRLFYSANGFASAPTENVTYDDGVSQAFNGTGSSSPRQHLLALADGTLIFSGSGIYQINRTTQALVRRVADFAAGFYGGSFTPGGVACGVADTGQPGKVLVWHDDAAYLYDTAADSFTWVRGNWGGYGPSFGACTCDTRAYAADIDTYAYIDSVLNVVVAYNLSTLTRTVARLPLTALQNHNSADTLVSITRHAGRWVVGTWRPTAGLPSTGDPTRRRQIMTSADLVTWTKPVLELSSYYGYYAWFTVAGELRSPSYNGSNYTTTGQRSADAVTFTAITSGFGSTPNYRYPRQQRLSSRDHAVSYAAQDGEPFFTISPNNGRGERVYLPMGNVDPTEDYGWRTAYVDLDDVWAYVGGNAIAFLDKSGRVVGWVPLPGYLYFNDGANDTTRAYSDENGNLVLAGRFSLCLVERAFNPVTQFVVPPVVPTRYRRADPMLRDFLCIA